MTSSSSTSPFRLTLLKVSDVLMEKNVQNLAFLCEDISPARRELITNARELFAALQGHDLLNERKVNVLIDWLDELRLLEASNLLKNYRKTHLTGHVKAQANCFTHEDLPLKYFCVSCDSKICPECALCVHNRDAGCDVISLDKMSNEMSQRREKLMNELETLKTGIASTEQLWEEKKEHLARCCEKSRTKVQRDYLTLIRKVENMKRLQIAVLDAKELANIKHISEEKKETQILENELAMITECHKISLENALDEIQKISKRTKKTAEIKDKLEKQKEMLKTVDLLYRKIPNDGAFCSITVSMLIGSVNLGSVQLLHTFDARQTSGGVLLICIDPKDSSKEFWRHLEKIDNHDDPVVMSNKNMNYDNGYHPLFVVGNTVFIVHPQLTGSLYDSVKSVSSLVIDEVPEGSWITSIATDYPNNDPNDEFIISTSCDHSIREYNVSGSALSVIDTRDTVRSNAICRVALNYRNLFAIIGRGLDDVILVDVDGTVKQCGTLRLPSAMSGMLPINIIWTGAKWLVLYISEGAEKEWKVIEYEETGKFVKVCDEGTSSNEMDVPLCVSRFKSTVYVTLASAEVRIFQY